MIETWVIAFLYAWKKKLNVKLIFNDFPIYFPLTMLLVYIVAEIMIKQTKQLKGLLAILESKKCELIIYCAKYHRNHESVMRDYMGNESYAL